MRHSAKFTPYIRRANGREKAESLRGAMQLAFCQIQGRPFFVLVQRGFPNLAVTCGESRVAIEDSLLWLNIRKRYGARFKDYARSTRALATGATIPEFPKRWDSGRYGKSLKGAKHA